MSVEELKDLVDHAKSKGLSREEFDKIYHECDRDYIKTKTKLESIEVKKHGR